MAPFNFKLARAKFARLHKNMRKPQVSTPVKKYVKRTIALNEELKYVYNQNVAGTDTSTLTATLTAGLPQLCLLNGIIQGATATNRVGDRARMEKFECGYHIHCDPTAGVDQLIIRFLFFTYKNPRGTAPAVTDITNSATPDTCFRYNYVDVDFKSRFHVLKDHTFQSCDHNLNFGTTGDLEYQLHFSFSLKNIMTDYSLNSGDVITAIDKNAVYLLLVTNSTVTVQPVTIHQDSYLYFRDA